MKPIKYRIDEVKFLLNRDCYRKYNVANSNEVDAVIKIDNAIFSIRLSLAAVICALMESLRGNRK